VNLNAKKLPPPVKKKRNLDLKTSMTRNVIKEARAKIDQSMEKLRDRVRNGPTEASIQRMEDALVKLQARTINDRLLLKEKEESLSTMELDFIERNKLLEAKSQVVESRYESMPDQSLSPVQKNERDALEQLRLQLEQRDTSLKELQDLLNEREAYIEQCENDLCDQAYKLTEREAFLEQAEENQGIKRAEP
jgi:hypothetical protein